MERSEPSFIPGWLKGAAGGGLAPHHYQDEGGFSRNKVTQQLLAVGNHLDSPRGSASSDRVFSPSFRRGHSNSSLERPALERDHLSTVHTHTGLNWSSSIHSHDISNWERDGYSVWSDREYEREGDRDFQPRKKEWLLGVVSDEREREREREHAENGMLWLSTAGLSGQNDTAMKLRRSQSMGLSPRLSDNGLHKLTEVVSTVPSASGGLATSLQKSVFERNFPSLCADDKHNSLLLSSGSASIASPYPSIASPRHLGRASSPGLPGGFANPISTVSASINACAGGVDVWSSALAEAPTSNGIVQGNSLAAVNVAPITSSSQTSASPGHGPSTTVMPLNMAEALTQNPPRVRTPPQLSLESQRLEELALRQSRQLIPMTPSLPKTMSLVDKAKSKTPRTVDGAITTSKLNQLSGSLQLNSSHKPITPSRSDTLKHSQGKLLVLKSSKDGVTISTTSKSDGTNVGQDTPQGNIGFTAASATNVPGISVSATGVRGQRKQPHDRRTPSLLGAAVPDGLRAKDPTLLVDDRRPSLQAQNRSDFFNALRKKAARNGSDANTSVSSCQTKGDSLSPREAEMANEVPKSNDSEVKENGISEDSHSTQSSLEIHSNGAVTHSSGNGLIVDSRVKDFSVESQEDSLHSFLPGDSEEEEAAFMRSLGWEENAEGSELTEEEINAFYQMRERKQILNSGGNYNFRALGVDHFVGSVGSMSSGFSSSDLKIDEAPSSLLGRALSNKAH